MTCPALDGPLFADVDTARRVMLAAAMGFPENYEWPRTRKGTINQRAAVKMIGNAVSVRTARALIGANLPGICAQARRAVSGVRTDTEAAILRCQVLAARHWHSGFTGACQVGAECDRCYMPHDVNATVCELCGWQTLVPLRDHGDHPLGRGELVIPRKDPT